MKLNIIDATEKKKQYKNHTDTIRVKASGVAEKWLNDVVAQKIEGETETSYVEVELPSLEGWTAMEKGIFEEIVESELQLLGYVTQFDFDVDGVGLLMISW